ncbi:MAG: hypothetical protein ACJ76J_27345 [Thermoanaerobaculia bacterium]
MKTRAGTVRAALVAAGAAIAAFAASAAPASAGVLVSTARSCSQNGLSQPFAGFGDRAYYTSVPGGSFEPGAPAWKLSGGAKIVSGNEPWYVGGRSQSRSLSLPAGATATSPAMCVGIGEPTLRYFAKSSSLLGLTGAMTVEVLTETSLGLVVAVPLLPGVLTYAWKPSLPTPVVANLLPLLPGQKTAVAFRFHAVAGNWGLDDVYVDPYKTR